MSCTSTRCTTPSRARSRRAGSRCTTSGATDRSAPIAASATFRASPTRAIAGWNSTPWCWSPGRHSNDLLYPRDQAAPGRLGEERREERLPDRRCRGAAVDRGCDVLRDTGSRARSRSPTHSCRCRTSARSRSGARRTCPAAASRSSTRLRSAPVREPHRRCHSNSIRGVSDSRSAAFLRIGIRRHRHFLLGRLSSRSASTGAAPPLAPRGRASGRASATWSRKVLSHRTVDAPGSRGGRRASADLLRLRAAVPRHRHHHAAIRHPRAAVRHPLLAGRVLSDLLPGARHRRRRAASAGCST